MNTVLVLGGGGVVGVAWETGLLAGLCEAGLRPADLTLVVGTSAGSIVGAKLRGGTLDERPGRAGGPTADDGAESLIDPSRIDRLAVAKIFGAWGGMQGPTPSVAAEIGELARVQQRDREPSWVESIGRTLRLEAWPEPPLLVCAVDTESGERRVFDRDCGVSIDRVVAASSAVPGIFPSVAIDGRIYMDGQVHSSTNADLLLDREPARALIAMPTNELNAQALGVHARRCVELEHKQLEAAGWQISLRTPSADDVAKMGRSLMDPRGVPAAYASGHATGVAWVDTL